MVLHWVWKIVEPHLPWRLRTSGLAGFRQGSLGTPNWRLASIRVESEAASCRRGRKGEGQIESWWKGEGKSERLLNVIWGKRKTEKRLKPRRNSFEKRKRQNGWGKRRSDWRKKNSDYGKRQKNAKLGGCGKRRSVEEGRRSEAGWRESQERGRREIAEGKRRRERREREQAEKEHLAKEVKF
jgi:hypothetical protein